MRRRGCLRVTASRMSPNACGSASASRACSPSSRASRAGRWLASSSAASSGRLRRTAVAVLLRLDEISDQARDADGSRDQAEERDVRVGDLAQRKVQHGADEHARQAALQRAAALVAGLDFRLRWKLDALLERSD